MAVKKKAFMGGAMYDAMSRIPKKSKTRYPTPPTGGPPKPGDPTPPTGTPPKPGDPMPPSTRTRKDT